MDPYLLLSGGDAVQELIAALKTTPCTDSCVGLTAGMINSTPILNKQKKMVLDNQTAFVEYVEEFAQCCVSVQDTLDGSDLGPDGDNMGTKFVAKLTTVWRLKSLGLGSIVDRIEIETTGQIQDYVNMVLKYVSENAVSEDYCKNCSKALEEACKTFTSSTVLLNLREKIEHEMDQARATGTKKASQSSVSDFMKEKTQANFNKLSIQLQKSIGVQFEDKDKKKLETLLFIIMEDVTKQFPAPSTWGDEVHATMGLLCNCYLANYVLTCLG